MELEKRGFENEVLVEVKDCSDEGNSTAVLGEEIELHGYRDQAEFQNRISVGPLKCSSGDIIPVVLLDSGQIVGICTDPSIWAQGYGDYMSRFGGSKPVKSKITNAIKNGREIDSGFLMKTKSTTAGEDVGDENKAVSDNLDHLRKQADASSTESVASTDKKVQQYNRSSKIKQYVKARAEGICEGCGKPAPFTSKDGEPYLHAHHIYELSSGGSDKPDTVIALCPNCHYRVHHGKDGEEYNEELLDKVREIENRSVE